VEGCESAPFFYFNGEFKVRYCTDHKLDGMVMSEESTFEMQHSTNSSSSSSSGVVVGTLDSLVFADEMNDSNKALVHGDGSGGNGDVDGEFNTDNLLIGISN